MNIEQAGTRLVQLFYCLKSVGYFSYSPVTDVSTGIPGYVLLVCSIVECLHLLRQRLPDWKDERGVDLLLALIVYDCSVHNMDEFENIGIEHVLLKWCSGCSTIWDFYDAYFTHMPFLIPTKYGLFTEELLGDLQNSHLKALSIFPEHERKKWWKNETKVETVFNSKAVSTKKQSLPYLNPQDNGDIWRLFLRATENYMWNIIRFSSETSWTVVELIQFPRESEKNILLVEKENPFTLPLYSRMEFPFYIYYIDILDCRRKLMRSPPTRNLYERELFIRVQGCKQDGIPISMFSQIEEDEDNFPFVLTPLGTQ
jgi:hypothetical protein